MIIASPEPMQLRFDAAEWAALAGFQEYKNYHNLLFLLYFLTIMSPRDWYAGSRVREPLREAYAMAALPRWEGVYSMCLASGMHATGKRIRGGNALCLTLLAGAKHGDTFTSHFIIQFFENIEKFHFRNG